MLASLVSLLFKLLESLVFLFLMVLTLFIQNLPVLIKLLVDLGRVILQLSGAAYRAVIVSIAPPFNHWTGIDLSTGLWPYLLIIPNFVGLGVFLSIMLPWRWDAWLIGLFAIHGLLVCLAWEGGLAGDSAGDGLNMGVDHQ